MQVNTEMGTEKGTERYGKGKFGKWIRINEIYWRKKKTAKS